VNTPEQSVIPSLSEIDFKEFLKSDVKESIKYVESHLPKNELDDTDYINKLLKDVNQHNINYSQEIVANKTNYSAQQLKLSNKIVEDT
jgi:hypothetical protein